MSIEQSVLSVVMGSSRCLRESKVNSQTCNFPSSVIHSCSLQFKDLQKQRLNVCGSLNGNNIRSKISLLLNIFATLLSQPLSIMHGVQQVDTTVGEYSLQDTISYYNFLNIKVFSSSWAFW